MRLMIRGKSIFYIHLNDMMQYCLGRFSSGHSVRSQEIGMNQFYHIYRPWWPILSSRFNTASSAAIQILL